MEEKRILGTDVEELKFGPVVKGGQKREKGALLVDNSHLSGQPKRASRDWPKRVLKAGGKC
jgi:hypothetical protein